MTISMIILYIVIGLMMLGCAALFVASVDLREASTAHLNDALDVYENLIAEIMERIDSFSADQRLPDTLYRNLVGTVAAITDPVNATIVRRTIEDVDAAIGGGLTEGGARFIEDMHRLALRDPELQAEYVGVISKAVTAARLWDLVHRTSNLPFLSMPAWAWNAPGERRVIERSRYDDRAVRSVVSRLGASGPLQKPVGYIL